MGKLKDSEIDKLNEENETTADPGSGLMVDDNGKISIKQAEHPTGIFQPGGVLEKGGMPSITEENLKNPLFSAIHNALRDWSINVPDRYSGYCAGNESHVQLILDSIKYSPTARTRVFEGDFDMSMAESLYDYFNESILSEFGSAKRIKVTIEEVE